MRSSRLREGYGRSTALAIDVIAAAIICRRIIICFFMPWKLNMLWAGDVDICLCRADYQAYLAIAMSLLFRRFFKM